MEILTFIVLALHLAGAVAILGSVVIRRGVVTPVLVWAARLQIVTGLILVGLHSAGDEPLNNTWVAVKFVVALAVVACAEIANARSKKDQPVSTLVYSAGALTLLNVLIALFWHP